MGNDIYLADNLVSFCRYCASELPTVYVYGGLGETVTPELLLKKAKQYPDFYTPERLSLIRAHTGQDTRGFDCSGLIKRWLMGGLDHYRYEPSLDWNADTMYQNASVSGSLDTLPERPGTLLHAKKHVGVYIGQGRVIESTTAFREAGGVQNTHISAQKWDAWFRHPLISY